MSPKFDLANSRFAKLVLDSFDINPKRLGAGTGDEILGYSDMMTAYMSYLGARSTQDAKFREFDEMDEYSTDISTMLDKLSREATLMNKEQKRIIWVTSENPTIEAYANKFIKRLQLEKNARIYCRYIGKYGRFVLRPVIMDPEHPRIEWLDDDLHQIEKQEADRYYRAVQTKYSPLGEWEGFLFRDHTYDYWDFVEFKIGTGPWGSSLLEGCRYIWRSLDLIEKSLELYRIVLSPQTTIFKVPIGQADPMESIGILKLYKRFLEQQTRKTVEGVQNMSLPPSPLTSIYFPVTDKNDGAGVDIQTNRADVRAIADVEYKRNKFLRKLGMPLDTEYNASKNLSGINIDVAARVEDIQIAFMAGIDRILQIEFALMGIYVSEDTYELNMSRANDLEETIRLEKLQLGVDIANQLFLLGNEVYGQSIAPTPLEFNGTQLPPLNSPDNVKLWKEYIVTEFLDPYFGDMIRGFEEFRDRSAEEKEDPLASAFYTEQIIKFKPTKVKVQSSEIDRIIVL